MKPANMTSLVKRCGSVFHIYKPTSATKSVGVMKKTKLLVQYHNGLGASNSADAHGFVEQQHYQFTGYEDEAVDEHGLTARQH